MRLTILEEPFYTRITLLSDFHSAQELLPVACKSTHTDVRAVCLIEWARQSIEIFLPTLASYHQAIDLAASFEILMSIYLAELAFPESPLQMKPIGNCVLWFRVETRVVEFRFTCFSFLYHDSRAPKNFGAALHPGLQCGLAPPLATL